MIRQPGGNPSVRRIKMNVWMRKLMTAASLALAAAASAETADDVIGKYVAARGGLDKIKAIQSLEMKIKANQQGLEFPGKMDLKRPEKMRLEMTIQGKTMIQAYDGKTAWMIMPFIGSPDPQTMSADEAKDVIEQADMDGPVVDYKAKGHSVELLGKEDVEGSPAYKLKVTLKNGDVSYVYIDTETALQVKETSKRKQQGSEIEVDSYLTNFKPVNGVLFPFMVENKVAGKSVGQFTIDDIKANVALDDGIFAMPSAAPKAAPEKEKK
jgi:outer membrane lipoprotein-sorting protein